MDVLKYKSGDKALIEVNVFDILLDHPDGTMCFVESTDDRIRGWISEKIITVCKTDDSDVSDWKLANDIINMKLSKLEDIFGDGFDYIDVFNMKPEVVRAKIDNYHNSIPKMGDVVECCRHNDASDNAFKGIFYAETPETYWVLCPDEVTPKKLLKYTWNVCKLEDCKIDIAGALKSLTEKGE